MWKNLSNFSDVALLFLRVTLGGFLIWIEGWRMLAGGLGKWKAIGASMKYLGITFWPGFWGFMAAFSESIGIGLLMVGLMFRPSALLLFITMAVTAWARYRSHGAITHPVELAIVFAALIFIGPGKYSVDRG